MIDGIDFMLALRGSSLERDAIFTYFPHSPPTPDWLSPSASVHPGAALMTLAAGAKRRFGMIRLSPCDFHRVGLTLPKTARGLGVVVDPSAITPFE